MLRFGDDSWVQLRPSRTEALVRACAEARDVRRAERLAEEACEGAKGRDDGLAGGFLAEDDFAEESAKHRAEDDAKRAEEKKADEKAG